ncbi:MULTISPECIES: Rv3654c family TadE-like protein [unclassified Nocardia]|uniref:Rv3654c family TadE-like protein n=1 Tax=unclassified Nocardia TaxID=2637762 RepID=UPI0033AE48D9
MTGARARWLAGDAGGATVFACVALAGLIALTLVIGQVGVVVVARHRAQAAADLGALGAASVLAEGAEAACAEAAEVGRRMGARVARCVVEQWDVVVVVEANATFGVFGVHVIAAAARAGPVDESV